MLIDLLVFLGIGIAAGWLAGQLVKGGGFGLVGDLIVGVIGALLGGFFWSARYRIGRLAGKSGHCTVGAIALIGLLRLAKR